VSRDVCQHRSPPRQRVRDPVLRVVWQRQSPPTWRGGVRCHVTVHGRMPCPFSWLEACTWGYLVCRVSAAQHFQVETDASELGVEAVLMQQGHPLAFIGKALGPRTRGLSVYEKRISSNLDCSGAVECLLTIGKICYIHR
jgi:hypothetical protein